MLNAVMSTACGVVTALVIGVLMGGEDRIRQHLAVVGMEEMMIREVGEESLDGLMLSLAGDVYDVSTSKELYGDSGWYKFLTGKDATLVFGTGKRVGYSLDPMLNGRDPSDFRLATEQELAKICYYSTLFSEKYPIVAHLSPSLYYSAGEPTVVKRAFVAACANIDASSHHDIEAEEGEGAMFADANKKESKCPVMKATKAVKKIAEDVNSLLRKMIA
eukprot:TRINITY_DN12128_c0_g1_i1.p1 TRINITY_DN12128_c0_g1~~TRINITY_DN12128_c0_g1_i1.p1  ORF type:complete len:218 (+),score=50.43 TRINITY_DN12128_c0_g1_i1:57-710(+)